MTKKILTLFFLVSLNLINAQDKPNDFLKNFNNELKIWKNTYSNFNLDEFEVEEKTNFKDLYSEKVPFKNLNQEYKTIGTYSPNKSKFIDIYSYLNLEKSGNSYDAIVDVDQNIVLYQINENTKTTLLSCGSSKGIDEVFWVNEKKLLLVGTQYSEVKKPIIIIVDFENSTVTEYANTNNNCTQKSKYNSPKLKLINIKGL